MARTINDEVQGTSLSSLSSPFEDEYQNSSSGEEKNMSNSTHRSSSDHSEAEAEEETISSDNSEASNEGCDEEDQQPEPPARFYFGPDKYTKTCKIVTRCTIVKVLEKLEQTLEDIEMKWFTDDQNQLKHLFHMPRERNRKSMGMLMLVLRTVVLEKCKAWWFVVNGVLVRYSLWEHEVISGLDCSVYPPNYLCLGSNDFVMKWFKRNKEISVSDVEKVLESMIACEDRLKMAVLYNLAMIMESKTKVRGPIDLFISTTGYL